MILIINISSNKVDLMHQRNAIQKQVLVEKEVVSFLSLDPKAKDTFDQDRFGNMIPGKVIYGYDLTEEQAVMQAYVEGVKLHKKVKPRLVLIVGLYGWFEGSMSLHKICEGQSIRKELYTYETSRNVIKSNPRANGTVIHKDTRKLREFPILPCYEGNYFADMVHLGKISDVGGIERPSSFIPIL